MYFSEENAARIDYIRMTIEEWVSKDEVCNMGESIKVITFELALRFLNDYINGDTYFKIHREHHNLDRARNQFKLVRDIAEREEKLLDIIKSLKEGK